MQSELGEHKKSCCESKTYTHTNCQKVRLSGSARSGHVQSTIKNTEHPALLLWGCQGAGVAKQLSGTDIQNPFKK